LLEAAREQLRRKLCHEAWNIGVVDQPAADIARHGIVRPPRWLAAPAPGTMLADPSCFARADGGFDLYAEYLDYRQPRGAIWRATVPAGADLATARFAPLLAEPWHMSYPFAFADEDGGRLLTAETWQAGRAMLWRQAGEGWEPAGVVLAGREVVDPTLWLGPDRWWLFCSFHDDGPDDRLHLFHAPGPTGPWTPHAANPVRVGAAGSRPAGPLFLADGVLIRPGQDCTLTYGGAVILHAVRRLDPEGYAEEAVRFLGPVPGAYPHGLHTVCPAGDMTLIDGKRWRRDLPGFARKLRRRLGV
jgi:hypothetical protein